jgi:hypothetical protein
MDWLGPRAAWAGPADLLFFWYGLGHNGPSAPNINPTILLEIGPLSFVAPGGCLRCMALGPALSTPTKRVANPVFTYQQDRRQDPLAQLRHDEPPAGGARRSAGWRRCPMQRERGHHVSCL